MASQPSYYRIRFLSCCIGAPAHHVVSYGPPFYSCVSLPSSGFSLMAGSADLLEGSAGNVIRYLGGAEWAE